MNAIDDARRDAGLKISDLAALLDAPYRTVQNWCNGSRIPPVWLQRLIVREIQATKKAD